MQRNRGEKQVRNEYKISFADYLEKKQGTIRQRYCEVGGFMFGHEMRAQIFSIMYENEEIATTKGNEEGKIRFANILVEFLNKVSSEIQVVNSIRNYSLKDGARRFTVMTREQYVEVLEEVKKKGEEKKFKNKTRVKEFNALGGMFYLSADVNICEQMEFCCEIIPEEERNKWFFYALPMYEKAYSEEFLGECATLDRKIKKDKIKGIQELNKAYLNDKKVDKNIPRIRNYNNKPSICRNPVIVSMAKIIADGVCELSDDDGKFHTAPTFEGYGPYLEVHHVEWLAKGGKDTIDNVVALCPICHRKMHVAGNIKDVKKLKKIAKQHKKRWEDIVQWVEEN